MRWIVGMILVSLVLTTGTAQADVDLTAVINAAYPDRAESAALHDIAHQRAVEIASDFSHNGWRGGMGEVLAWNSGGDPAATALNQWLGSPPHNALLSDPTYTDIGCGSHVVDGRYYAVCLLAVGSPVTAPAPPAWTAPAPTPSAVLLPNAAMP